MAVPKPNQVGLAVHLGPVDESKLRLPSDVIAYKIKVRKPVGGVAQIILRYRHRTEAWILGPGPEGTIVPMIMDGSNARKTL